MGDFSNLEKDPVRIDDGIFWVGYSDNNSGLHCNPYLIVEGEEAVLIDGGSRDDFSNVMLKILKAGINPIQIKRLIYQHYDPDLCGSLPQFEELINHDKLKIISHSENNIFIHYYSAKTEKVDFRDLNCRYIFESGRYLEFFATPYCHQPGSFITYDSKTKTLFSSDLFGSFDNSWTLNLELNEHCRECTDFNNCKCSKELCKIKGIKEFHQKVMTSNLAAEHTLKMIEKLDVNRIAPQHGSIIHRKEDVETILRHLKTVKNVGIDFLLAEVQDE